MTESNPPSFTARWFLATRPKTLPMAVAPVIAGLSLAVAQTGELAVLTALGTLLAAIAIQIGTNLHNDAVDFERGTDNAETRLGPRRATAEGWLTARQVKRAAYLTFALAFVLGMFLLVRGGWPILLIGIASLISAYSYTGGPRPIAYNPYGELFVIAFFGLAAVGGTYYLQTLSFGWTPLVTGFALGLPAAALLVVNNYRDLENDRRSGRRTLCHFLGPARARLLYATLVIGSPLVLLTAPFPGAHWPMLLAFPYAFLLLLKPLFAGATGTQLNLLLARTSLYQSMLALLLIIGLAF